MRRRLLPFHDKRDRKIELIVLHAVAFNVDEVIEIFKQHQVCSHYLIAEDGEVWQLVGEKHAARHAGKSKWRNFDNLNSASIGIELCSSSLGQFDYTEKQKEALYNLLKRLIKKYKIKKENIVGHSDIAPTRKADPGKAFFWEWLSRKDIGLWFSLENKEDEPDKDIKDMLGEIGYDTTDVVAAACAFCRRFLPEKIRCVEDIVYLVNNPIVIDEEILKDGVFRQTLDAVVYAYRNASKTPCNM